MTTIKAFPVSVLTDSNTGKTKKAPAIPKGVSWRDAAKDIGSQDQIRSKNIGIIVPDNVLVIDLDLYKGVTTDSVDNVLGCKLDWDMALLQKTPSCGAHYGFLIESPVLQGSDLLGLPGFDTRTSSGWIASGEMYDDQTMCGIIDTLASGDLPSLPATAAAKLAANQPDDLDDFAQFIEDQPLDEITEEQAQTFLEMLPDDCASGSKWLTVAQALRHQFKGSEEQDLIGWRLFDEFSKRQPDEYDHDNNKKRYFSFERGNSGNKTTFATVIKWAGGWSAYHEKTATDMITTTSDDIDELLSKAAKVRSNVTQDQLIKTIQQRYVDTKGYKPSLAAIRKEIRQLKAKSTNKKLVSNYLDNYVYVQANNTFLNRVTRSEICPRAFDMTFTRITPYTSDGEKQRATTYAENSIDTVFDTMYVPRFPEMFEHGGENYYNTYRPHVFDRVTSSDIVERIKNHIAFLLPDETEQQLLINYLAHNVQHQGTKIQWAILLQGIPGDGKSLFAEMMQIVLGYRNVRMLDADELKTNFNGWAVGQCMTFIEEVMLDSGHKYEALNKIKPNITNENISVTAKGKDPVTRPNTTNYIMFTNYRNAIPVDHTDRRYAVFFSQWQDAEKLAKFEKENPNYFSDLYRDMRINASEIAEWLGEHKIPDTFRAMKRAPMTKSKMQMIENSKPASEVAFDNALERFQDFDINNNVINVTRLNSLVRDSYDESGELEGYPNHKQIGPLLLSRGFQKLGRTKKIGNCQFTLYAKDDSKNANDLYNELIADDCGF